MQYDDSKSVIWTKDYNETTARYDYTHWTELGIRTRGFEDGRDGLDFARLPTQHPILYGDTMAAARMYAEAYRDGRAAFHHATGSLPASGDSRFDFALLHDQCESH